MTRTRGGEGAEGDRVPWLRSSGAAAQVRAIARLAALKARVDGFGPDDWQVMEALHRWALGLPHEARLRWLDELGGREEDRNRGGSS
jgi:hypothetical protein